jgi:hypothetical protein
VQGSVYPSKIQLLASLSWRGVSLDGEQGSGPQKSRCEVTRWGLRGTGVVIAVSLIIPLGHWAASCHINDFHLYGALWVVNFVSQFSWNTRNKREWQKPYKGVL